MQAISIQGMGLKPRLGLAQRPQPKPGPNDVLVQVHAASVNPKDLKLNYQFARLATPLGMRWLPPLFGDDLSGIVRACGAQVEAFKPGDEIYGMDMRPRTASLAEYAVIDQRRIAHKPNSLDHAQAAAMPLAALTALQGLRLGRAKASSQVLIIGASGGVGTFAVQIGKAMGCQVSAICSRRNTALVKQLGADQVIDYTTEDFRRRPERFDLVFDVTSYETPGSIAALRKADGWFISTGGHGHAVLSTWLGRTPRSSLIRVESWREDLDELAQMVANDQLRPIIDSHYPLADSQQAYERSRSGRARGKIVITMPCLAQSG